MMAETAFLAESTICYPPLFDQLRDLVARPTETAETLALSAVAASHEQNAGAIIVLSTRWAEDKGAELTCSGGSARLISKYRPACPIICGERRLAFDVIPVELTHTVTRNDQTARQLHLSRGVYPVWYPEPRGIPSDKWQTDVDNRIRWAVVLARSCPCIGVTKGTSLQLLNSTGSASSTPSVSR